MNTRNNIFFSVAIKINELPKDLPLQSLSVYFALVSLQVLKKCSNENIWLKWPNDLYNQDIKFGGIITNVIGSFAIIGIGINIYKTEDFGYVNCDNKNNKNIIQAILNKLHEKLSWIELFEEYKLEFEKSRNLFFNINNSSEKISLSQAILNNDGSITINGERFFSMR